MDGEADILTGGVEPVAENSAIARVRRIFAPREVGITPGGLFWISVIALVGVFYFVGIGVGYLAFAGVIQEVRLRYILAGIFAVLFVLRTYALLRHRVRTTRLGAGMYGLFAVITVVQALWFVPISNAGGLEIYLTTVGETIISGGIMAIMGEAIGWLCVAGRFARAAWRVAIAFGICVGTIGLGVLLGWSTTAEMRLMFQSQTGEMLYNYLALGDSIALLGLLMMGLVRRPMLRLGVLAVAALALFFAYSRTSFFLFLFSSMFILLVGGKYSQRIGVAAVIAILAAVVISVASESEILQPTIERMTVLLFNREADESYAARKVILSEGLQYLKENWLLGRFLDEWWREGVGGNYIHNWLSFWQAYGLFPFLGSLVLFGTSGWTLWKQLPRPSASTGTAIALWMYAVMAIITARAYSWPYMWLAFGFVTAAVYSQANERGAGVGSTASGNENSVSAPLA